MYSLLTGQPPFHGATPLDTLVQVLEQSPVLPSKLNRQVPRDLETICLKYLEKPLEHRYGSAAELAAELSRFLNDEPIRARPATALRRTWAWALRRPWAMVAAASLLLLVSLCLAFGLWAEVRQQRWNSLFLEAKTHRLALTNDLQGEVIELTLANALRGMPIVLIAHDALSKREISSKKAIGLLTEAAQQRPDRRLYDEALELLLA